MGATGAVRTMLVHAQGAPVELSYTDEVRPTAFSTFLADALTVRTADQVVGDLGTGTGILAIALVLRGAPRVIAVDRSEHACALAEWNVARNGVADRVEVVHADLDEWRPSQSVDLIVSNPPTMPVAPETPAFAAGSRGSALEFVDRLIDGLDAWLAEAGRVQIALSSLVDLEVIGDLEGRGFEVRSGASVILPFRDFYLSAYGPAQVRRFIDAGRAIRRSPGRSELSEIVTVYEVVRAAGRG